MITVNSIPLCWDSNPLSAKNCLQGAGGNLTSDGVTTYTYDLENRLTALTTGAETAGYAYNGLGDRLSQTEGGVTTDYTLDLNTGLTQVLADSGNTYLYDLSRLGQESNNMEYFLEDALGSVRQMVDSAEAVTLEKSYTPFGEALSESGTGESMYGYTGSSTPHGR